MAAPIATKEAVFDACDTLVAEGAKPSILTVQEKIGGGSYSTVKRYLDAWTQERAKSKNNTIDLPPAAVEAAVEMAKSIWAQAERDAMQKTAAIRESAENKVAMISDDLEIAQKEIARLEGVTEAGQAEIANLQALLAAQGAELNELGIKAGRVDDLERRLQSSDDALRACRAESEARAIEASRLAGEAEALRKQVQELTAALIKLGSSSSSQ